MKSAEHIEAGLRTKPVFGMRRGHLAISLAISIVMLLGITTCASAGNGPGLAFKMGVQTFESPVTLKDTTRTRYELELSTQLFADDHLDFSLAVGGSTLGEYNDSDSYYDGDVFVEEYYSDDLSLIDVRLAARLHPLGQSGPIRPYLGAGLGYFWFLDSWDDHYYETIEDPDFPGTFLTFEDHQEDTSTLADGFFPFVMAGVNVAVNDNLEVLAELQYDISKEASGFDFSGPIYMLGARFRF
jgi:outer membrane protein W